MNRVWFLGLLGLGFLAGCGVLRSLAGRNTVDLEGADVRSMGVDLRKEEKTICPRERVQMAVFAEVVLKGESQVSKLETWAGTGQENRNGKLDFSDFAFHSDAGTFDENGWFSPTSDLTKTAGREIQIDTVYRRRPDKFTFKTGYKPDYRCIHSGGASGEAGPAGEAGAAGQTGESGSSGSSTSAGSAGRDGGAGGQGAPGGTGRAGPKLTAFATLVKTPFYEKLLAVRLEGGANDFLLFHPEGKLVIAARGGDGGPGGAGGRGGDGGSGGGGNPPGSGGHGGAGGNGGNGGSGGPGGSIELYFDERFPEIGKLIELATAGGSAGLGGSAGTGGSAGRAGSTFGGTVSASDGKAGASGAAGAQGSPGPAGTELRRAARVADKFDGQASLTVLSP